MKFNKIGELVFPDSEFDYYGWDQEDDSETWIDKVRALEEKSDLFLVTLKDGNTLLAAEVNMLLGECDDCVAARYDKNVVKIEGFERED